MVECVFIDGKCMISWIKKHNAGADPAFLIRGGLNSEIFLSDLAKLFKKRLVFCSSWNALFFRGSTFCHSTVSYN